MRLKTIALHLAYDIGTAVIGLAADKLRTGIVQRQNAPKASGNDLQEIKDPFESSPIKVNARSKLTEGAVVSSGGIIAGYGPHSASPISVGITADRLYTDKAPPSALDTLTDHVERITGDKTAHDAKLHVRRIALTEDDLVAINYGISSIQRTQGQKGPVAAINRAELTKIYSILLKLQHKAASHDNSR